MSKIITISRQYASGGSDIGRKVAKLLDIPYYDREIIDATAKESGFDPGYIERAEQSSTTSSSVSSAAARTSFVRNHRTPRAVKTWAICSVTERVGESSSPPFRSLKKATRHSPPAATSS